MPFNNIVRCFKQLFRKPDMTPEQDKFFVEFDKRLKELAAVSISLQQNNAGISEQRRRIGEMIDRFQESGNDEDEGVRYRSIRGEGTD